ncbi:hypothetical protein ACJ6WI_07025 [Stenotrophomonas maltophilia]
MRHRVILVSLMLLAGGCSPSAEEVEKQKTEAIRSKVDAGVRQALKDPDSAKIVVRQVFPLFDGIVACGVVNAKNSFGGYTGDMAFNIGVNADGRATTPNIANDEMSSAVSAAMCDFEKEYASLPGHYGKPATSEQSKQLVSAYERKVREVIEKISSEK